MFVCICVDGLLMDVCVWLYVMIGGCCGSGNSMVAEPSNAQWVRVECHALCHTSPSVRLRRGGGDQQPIQPKPTNIKQLSGIIGRYVARVWRHTCYRKCLASKLHTTGHRTDDMTKNELSPTIPIQSLQLRPTGYGHPSTKPPLPLRRAIATGSQAVRLAWARRGPRSHHTCPLPNAIVYRGKRHTGEVYWLGFLALSRVPAWRPPH